MFFDNFVVNGKNLGKGRANVGVIGTGLFKLVPKLTLSNLKLEDVNLEGIYNEKSSQIDTFTDKINSLTTQEKADKSTADFIKETTTKVTTLTTNTDNFINSKLRENIEKVNVLKQDYVGLTDLKSKAQKIMELNNEIKPLAKSINIEKENIEKTITEIELERDIALTNVSDNLTKLEKEISLNDFNNINSNNSVQNMNLYIFLDKGKDLEISLNSALKATALIKEISRSKGDHQNHGNDDRFPVSSQPFHFQVSFLPERCPFMNSILFSMVSNSNLNYKFTLEENRLPDFHLLHNFSE